MSEDYKVKKKGKKGKKKVINMIEIQRYPEKALQSLKKHLYKDMVSVIFSFIAVLYDCSRCDIKTYDINKCDDCNKYLCLGCSEIHEKLLCKYSTGQKIAKFIKHTEPDLDDMEIENRIELASIAVSSCIITADEQDDGDGYIKEEYIHMTIEFDFYNGIIYIGDDEGWEMQYDKCDDCNNIRMLNKDDIRHFISENRPQLGYPIIAIDSYTSMLFKLFTNYRKLISIVSKVDANYDEEQFNDWIYDYQTPIREFMESPLSRFLGIRIIL